MSSYAYLPMLTHLVCHHTPTYQCSPILTYIFLRNCTKLLRSWHCALLSSMGTYTLETYLLQHHLWLSSNAKSLVVLIPGDVRSHHSLSLSSTPSGIPSPHAHWHRAHAHAHTHTHSLSHTLFSLSLSFALALALALVVSPGFARSRPSLRRWRAGPRIVLRERGAGDRALPLRIEACVRGHGDAALDAGAARGAPRATERRSNGVRPSLF